MKSVKPMSPTKMALIENMVKKMSGFLREIEEIDSVSVSVGEGEENIVSILKPSVEIFSESVNNFRALEINDKLLLLAQHSLKAGVVSMRLLKRSLKKEITAEMYELMKKSGLLCGLV